MRRAGSSFAALAGLAGFFVGVPVALSVTVGWPLPTASEVRAAVQLRYLPGHLLAQIGACAAWLCWTWLLAATIRMGAAAWQDRPSSAPRGTVWLGPIVTRAVSALVVCSGLFARGPAWSTSRPATPSVGAAASPAARNLPSAPVSSRLPSTTNRVRTTGGNVDLAPALLASAMTAGPSDAPPAAAVTHKVQPGDVLWNLARDHLADPLRWPEIWELNRGRLQPDGRTMTNPDRIYPGWELLLPVDAATNLAGAPTGSRPAPPAGRAAPPPRAPSAALPATTARTPQSSTARTPPPDAPIGPAGQPVTVGRAQRQASGAATSTGRRRAHSGVAAAVEAASPVLAGLVGGSAVLLLARMRRGQSARSRPGRRIRLPDPALAEIETALSATSPADPRWVEATLRLAGDHLARHPQAGPLHGVRITRGGAELVLSDPVPAATPFVASERGWRISHHGDVALAAAANLLCATPVLVSVGTASDGADVMVNLEVPASINLAGDPEAVAGLAATMALGLAAAPWADGIRVLADEDLAETLGPLDRLVRLSPEAFDQAAGLAVDALRAAAALGAASVGAARLRTPEGPWAPTAIISAAPLPDELAERAVDLAKRGAGLVVAAPNLAGASVTWDLADDGMKVLGLKVSPHRLDEPVRDAIRGLVETALAPGDVAVSEPPYAALAAERETAEQLALIDPAAYDSKTANINHPVGPTSPVAAVPELLLLGPVGLVGGTAVPRPKVLEALTYLASHPAGVTTDVLTTALWPARAPVPKTVYNLISETRRDLGARPDGSQYLIQVNARWVLQAGTDVARFRALAKQGRTMEALRLVRGRPYESLEDPSWTTVEGHIADLEGLVVQVASEATAAALSDGDLDRVEEAARAGLTVCPWHEGLYQLRIDAAERSGDRTRARRLTAERDAVLADDVYPYDQQRATFR